MTSASRLRRSSPQPPLVSIGEGNGTLSSQFLDNSLLSFDEMPEWLQDNNAIRYGYRRISGSVKISFRSWSYIHNELVNIYSHLIPVLVFLLSERHIIDYLTSKYPRITSADIFIFNFFLLAAIVCLGLSTTYHTLTNHSSEVKQLLLRFDLVGIVFLALGDFISGIYMIFWCEPWQCIIYWSMVS